MDKTKISYENIKSHSIAIIPLLSILVFAAIFYIHYDLLNIEEINISSWSPESNQAIEFRNRQIWGLTSVFLFMVVAMNLTVACIIIFRNVRRTSSNKFSPWLLVVSSIGIFYLFKYSFNVSGGAGVTLLDEVFRLKEIDAKAITDYSMALSAVTVWLNTIAMNTVIYRTKTLSVIDIKKRFFQFKASIYTSTLFLFAGILQVFFLYRWAILSYPRLDDNSNEILADSLALSGSLIYTLLFLAMFLPVSVTLNNWSQKLAEEKTSTLEGEKVDKWLAENGLYHSPRKTLGSFAVLATPSIITILYEIVSSLLKL